MILNTCSGSSEPSMIEFAINTTISCTGWFNPISKMSTAENGKCVISGF